MNRTESPGVTSDNDAPNALVTITVTGPWGPELRLAVDRRLRKAFAEHPAAVIVDLCELDDRPADSAATWLHAFRAGSDLEPPVTVAVAVPPGGPLARRIGTLRFPPAFATPAEARTAVLGDRPLSDRMLLRLPSGPGAPRAARSLITEACEQWDLPDLADGGRLVISELVGNAVEHAGTDILVLVFRRGASLHISVRDRDRGVPLMSQVSEQSLRGRGLHLVQVSTSSWGVTPTLDGKVVWAVLKN